MSFKTCFTKHLISNQLKCIDKLIRFTIFNRNLSQFDYQLNNNSNLKNRVYFENSFTKTKQLLNFNQKTDGSVKWVTMYCCGPTVYDDSHLGHALTYIRCDLIRRVLLKYHNINVFLAINITDIDDKIIAKAIQMDTDFRKVSNFYCNSFMEDMKSLNILDANCYLRVSDHMKTIVDYINVILGKGLAYIAPNGDINFDFELFRQTYNITNSMGTDIPVITDKSMGKKSPKDFALWKSAKPGEPKWDLTTAEGQTLPGRPGWHIECSALAHKVFGNRIDLHFGGTDLRFPHHHCESCCSHAFLQTDYSKPLYSWVDIWLHSGHLNLKSEKMSKSLGNVILIKDFLKDYSPNILRLFCIRLHYRTDLVYEEHLLQEMQNTDKKLLDFKESLNLKISELSSDYISSAKQNLNTNDFSEAIDTTERLIFEGISDDFDLEIGLNAVLDLAKHFNSTNDYSILDLIRTKTLLNKWTDSMGLKYSGNTSSDSDSYCDNQSLRETVLINSFVKFRSDIRESVLKSIKDNKKFNSDNSEKQFKEIQNKNKELLQLCDRVREELDGFGIKLKDLPVSKS